MYKNIFVVRRIPNPNEEILDSCVLSGNTEYNTYPEAEAKIASLYEAGSTQKYCIEKFFVPNKKEPSND